MHVCMYLSISQTKLYFLNICQPLPPRHLQKFRGLKVEAIGFPKMYNILRERNNIFVDFN